jgi:primosomal protein N' (replication factor Y)
MGTRARIELVDMREEIRAGHRQALSRALLQAADRSLESGEQVIMFLNRRGLATFFLCSDCGRSIQCPGCSVSMVQHQDLVCHYCGYSVPIPDQCPGCGGKRVKGLGMGTQRLESLIRKTWPAARVLRLDRDTARGVDGYLEIYEAFESGRADVLVGTELVAKGFDIERVTAVGVIDADMPLHFPDYRSAETTFGLLTQVAGRAGRGHRPARVVAQTTNPEHYSLRLAAQGDYDAFYRAELPGRKVFNFPPFTQLARMTYSHTDEHQARITAEKAAADLAAAIDSEGLTGIEVLGPSPAFLQKLRGEFRWQVTVKGPNLDPVRNLVPQERGWAHDVDPYW